MKMYVLIIISKKNVRAPWFMYDNIKVVHNKQRYLSWKN